MPFMTFVLVRETLILGGKGRGEESEYSAFIRLLHFFLLLLLLFEIVRNRTMIIGYWLFPPMFHLQGYQNLLFKG